MLDNGVENFKGVLLNAWYLANFERFLVVDWSQLCILLHMSQKEHCHRLDILKFVFSFFFLCTSGIADGVLFYDGEE